MEGYTAGRVGEGYSLIQGDFRKGDEIVVKGEDDIDVVYGLGENELLKGVESLSV